MEGEKYVQANAVHTFAPHFRSHSIGEVRDVRKLINVVRRWGTSRHSSPFLAPPTSRRAWTWLIEELGHRLPIHRFRDLDDR